MVDNNVNLSILKSNLLSFISNAIEFIYDWFFSDFPKITALIICFWFEIDNDKVLLIIFDFYYKQIKSNVDT